MLVGRERAAREFDLLQLKNDRLGKSAAGAPLAEQAVADRRKHCTADGPIANAAAQAAAFVDVSHKMFSRTRRSLQAPGPAQESYFAQSASPSVARSVRLFTRPLRQRVPSVRCAGSR